MFSRKTWLIIRNVALGALATVDTCLAGKYVIRNRIDENRLELGRNPFGLPDSFQALLQDPSYLPAQNI